MYLWVIGLIIIYKRKYSLKSMKKIAALLVLLFVAGPLLADDDFGFRFGLKASPNVSWFRTETRGYSNDGLDLGFSYGLIVDYGFAENYSFSTGLNILRTGGTMRYRYTYDPGGQNLDTEKRRDHYLRYIEIPVSLKLSTAEMGYISYFGRFGLDLGFNIQAKADDRIYLSEDSTLRTKDLDISDYTRFFRAALIIGAGLEYNMGGLTSLLAGLTFHNGFSNTLNKDNPFDPAGPSPSALNNYFELTLGVMF